MIAEIIAVGTELLMGQIVNTNAQYISSKLQDAGINVYYHTVVGDNPERLKSAIKIATKRSDVVILTGGLGPTMDDLTKETASSCLGRKLILHEDSLARIKAFFDRLNREMTQNNIKQAYLPENAIVFNNNNGSAPGCMIEDGGKTVIMLPGPPAEMEPMFDEYVIPHFLRISDCRLESKHIRVFGIGESMLEDMLIDLFKNQTNPTLATYAKVGEVEIRVTARYGDAGDRSDQSDAGDRSDQSDGDEESGINFDGNSGADRAGVNSASVGGASVGNAGVNSTGVSSTGVSSASVSSASIISASVGSASVGGSNVDGAGKNSAGVNNTGVDSANVDILTPMVREIQGRLGAHIFSLDDEELEVVAFKAMLEKGYTLSLAESCTGGRIASCLTSIPGASKVLKGGAVTYSNESKVDLLGVSEDTLKAHGAVSSQVAEEMAMGALSRFGADIALASTGIAGPGGGSKEKPVGLVYLAISMGGKSKVKKLNFIGGRERIIRFACLHAFDMIRRLTLGLPWVE